MNPISQIVRIVFGAVLIILSYSTYQRSAGHLAAGEPMEIFGHATNATPGQLMLAFAAIGLIGLFMVILGVVKLLKKS